MNDLDKNFEQLVKSRKLDSPSLRFTMNVMDKIHQLDHQFVYKPVISKWGWLSITLMVTVFVVYASFFGQTSGSETPGLYDKFIAFVSEKKPEFTGVPKVDIDGFFNQIPSILYLSIIAISLLVICDQIFLRRKKESHA